MFAVGCAKTGVGDADPFLAIEPRLVRQGPYERAEQGFPLFGRRLHHPLAFRLPRGLWLNRGRAVDELQFLRQLVDVHRVRGLQQRGERPHPSFDRVGDPLHGGDEDVASERTNVGVEASRLAWVRRLEPWQLAERGGERLLLPKR